MFKSVLYTLACVSLATTISLAQGTPSSKATAQINTAVGCTATGALTVVDPNTGTQTQVMNCHDVYTGTPIAGDPATGFVPVMQATVKVSNSQSLFVSPSLVTGLYTQTKTVTKTNSTSSAVAAGSVFLRAVLRDANNNIVQVAAPVAQCDPNNPAYGCGSVGKNFGVTIDSRLQSLTQSISQCITYATDGTTQSGTCDFTLTTDLILSTTSAHTFNFIFDNVGVGVYTVSVEAAVNASANATTGSTAVGAAAFGLGSMTVESVRLVHDFSF